MFPSSRNSMVDLTGGIRTQISKQFCYLKFGLGTSLAQFKTSLRQVLRGLLKHSGRLMLWLSVTIVFVIVPPMLVWLVGNKNALDGYDDTQVHEGNTQTIALLLGERLVPPPALPPEMFTTQEVLQISSTLVNASRDWRRMDDDFSQRLLRVFKVMKDEYGYDMAMLEGYRSPDRQNELAKKGNSVTNAGAYQSYHQFGLAADCAFERDGKLVISEKDPWAMRGYQLYGQVAESMGLHWGGRWKMMDFGHVELRKSNTVIHKNS